MLRPPPFRGLCWPADTGGRRSRCHAGSHPLHMGASQPGSARQRTGVSELRPCKSAIAASRMPCIPDTPPLSTTIQNRDLSPAHPRQAPLPPFSPSAHDKLWYSKLCPQAAVLQKLAPHTHTCDALVHSMDSGQRGTGEALRLEAVHPPARDRQVVTAVGQAAATEAGLGQAAGRVMTAANARGGRGCRTRAAGAGYLATDLQIQLHICTESWLPRAACKSAAVPVCRPLA